MLVRTFIRMFIHTHAPTPPPNLSNGNLPNGNLTNGNLAIGNLATEIWQRKSGNGNLATPTENIIRLPPQRHTAGLRVESGPCRAAGGSKEEHWGGGGAAAASGRASGWQAVGGSQRKGEVRSSYTHTHGSPFPLYLLILFYICLTYCLHMLGYSKYIVNIYFTTFRYD